MNKREAKRHAVQYAYHLLNNDHNNEFLSEYPLPRDQERMAEAWDELLNELERRGFPPTPTPRRPLWRRRKRQ